MMEKVIKLTEENKNIQEKLIKNPGIYESLMREEYPKYTIEVVIKKPINGRNNKITISNGKSNS